MKEKSNCILPVLLPYLRCCCFLPSFLFFTVIAASAQISEQLYKALPEWARPANRLRPTESEVFRIFTSDAAVLQPFTNELTPIAKELEARLNKSTDSVKNARYAYAIGMYYSNLSMAAESIHFLKAAYLYGGQRELDHGTTIDACLAVAYIYSNSLLKTDSAFMLLKDAVSLSEMYRDSLNLTKAYIVYSQIYSALRQRRKAVEYIDLYFKKLPPEYLWSNDYAYNVMTKANLLSILFKTEGKLQDRDNGVRMIRELMEKKKGQMAYWYSACYYHLGFFEYYSGNYRQALALLDSTLLPQFLPNSYGFQQAYLYKVYRAASMVKLNMKEGIAILDTIPIPRRAFVPERIRDEFLYQDAVERGDWHKAYTYYAKRQAALDSVAVTEQQTNFYEADRKYNLARSEVTIANLKNTNLTEKNRKNRIIIYVLIFSFILLLMLLFGYMRYKAARARQQQALRDAMYSMDLEMEGQRIELQGKLQQSVTDAKQMISHNMHDELGGSMAALTYLIADKKDRAGDDKVKALLEDIESEARAVYTQAREFMHNLYNTYEGQASLYNVPTLLQLLSLKFGSTGSLRIKINAGYDEADRMLSPQQHAELYMVIQEAVTNTLKHANASEITISIGFEDSRCSFSIQDNGRGSKKAEGGLGLKGMRVRVQEKLGGNIEVASENSGTVIKGFFPIGGSPEEA